MLPRDGDGGPGFRMRKQRQTCAASNDGGRPGSAGGVAPTPLQVPRHAGVAERDRLVEAHLPLARTLARRFTDRGQPLDDLEQVAASGPRQGRRALRPEHGAEFSTYAAHTILGELKRFFRDTTWAVRAPRRLQELYLELTALVSELSQQKGRSPTIGELAAAAAVSRGGRPRGDGSRAGLPLRVARHTEQRRRRRPDRPSRGEVDKGLADAPRPRRARRPAGDASRTGAHDHVSSGSGRTRRRRRSRPSSASARCTCPACWPAASPACGTPPTGGASATDW